MRQNNITLSFFPQITHSMQQLKTTQKANPVIRAWIDSLLNCSLCCVLLQYDYHKMSLSNKNDAHQNSTRRYHFLFSTLSKQHEDLSCCDVFKIMQRNHVLWCQDHIHRHTPQTQNECRCKTDTKGEHVHTVKYSTHHIQHRNYFYIYTILWFTIHHHIL